MVVLFFHAGVGFHGGYVGVDVFFVISGYLITGLILKDMDSGRFRILEFWERRVRRILPALAVVVLACFGTGWLLFFPYDFEQLGESMAAQSLLASNIYFWRTAGYFSQNAVMKPLLHTWSLAVEEQFYLFFPFLLVALNRFSRSLLTPAILLLSSVSFGLSVYWSDRHPVMNFFILPTRTWELMMGSFLAVIGAPRAWPRWFMEAMSWGGLLAILLAVFFYSETTPFPGVAALAPCAGAALVIWANGGTLTSAGRLLSARPVVFVGLISYSLYLWHWPVIVFYSYGIIGKVPVSHRMLLLLASMVLAVLSWRYVETPFRRRIALKNRRQVFTFATVTTAGLLLAGLTLVKLKGVPSRIPLDAAQYASGKGDRAFLSDVGLKRALAGDFIELGSGDKQKPAGFLVWGDSHAMAVMPVLDRMCKERSIRGVGATNTGTAPLTGYESGRGSSLGKDSPAFGDAVVKFVKSEHVSDVLLVARWDFYLKLDSGTDRIRTGLLATIDALRGSGARIWILRQVPIQRWDVPHVLANTVYHHGDPDALAVPLAEHLGEYQRQSPIFEGLSGQEPEITVLDPTGLFLDPMKRCRLAQDGKSLYSDETHLTIAGSMVLKPLFEPIFASRREKMPRSAP